MIISVESNPNFQFFDIYSYTNSCNDMTNWSYFLFMNFLIYVDSFMPIHTGGETDLRFVYCAGKRKEKSYGGAI